MEIKKDVVSDGQESLTAKKVDHEGGMEWESEPEENLKGDRRWKHDDMPPSEKIRRSLATGTAAA